MDALPISSIHYGHSEWTLFRSRPFTMDYVATKNEPKVAITSEYFYKQPLINEKISHTLVSLINHDGNQLNCGQYVSYVFDCSTGILCHCDDDNITQISDLPKGVYMRESHKKKSYVRLNRCIICCLYQNTPSEKI